MSNYAIRLFSVIDRRKVDPSQPIPDELAEQLQMYLEGQFGIKCLDTRIEATRQELLLVFNALEQESLPALFALADVQHTQVYRYDRRSAEEVILTPVGVKPE